MSSSWCVESIPKLCHFFIKFKRRTFDKGFILYIAYLSIPKSTQSDIMSKLSKSILEKATIFEKYLCKKTNNLLRESSLNLKF